MRNKLEMVLFTKKRSEIGGNGIDEVAQFLRIFVTQVIKVCLKRRKLQLTQPPREAAVHHVFLGFR